jgi:hypothetical protein
VNICCFLETINSSLMVAVDHRLLQSTLATIPHLR